MPYPPRPQLRPLPAFAGTARTGTVPSQRLQAQLEAFVLGEYAAGRSLRQIAELIDRSPTAVRRVLDKHGVPRRAVGAPRQTDQAGLRPPTSVGPAPRPGQNETPAMWPRPGIVPGSSPSTLRGRS
jgi:hypothetical protein